MLRGEWKNESAQHRAEFLACLENGLSVADEAFLEEVRGGDRSSTVRDEALRLLRLIPGSRILNMYAGILKEHLHYRRLFGWSIDPVAYSEELKKTGINEVSSNKGESDSDYILRQMAQYMPLSFWCGDGSSAIAEITAFPEAYLPDRDDIELQGSGMGFPHLERRAGRASSGLDAVGSFTLDGTT